MARQRFIHPEIWKDPVFGRLTPQEQVLFIGLFSIADDDGRTNADPAFLKSELFTYKDYTNKKVQAIRDAVVEKVPSVHLYRGKGLDLIALLKWSEYQKPKYPKPSKLPAPFIDLSPIVPPSLEEPSPDSTHGLGQGREGLGRAGFGLESSTPAIELIDHEHVESQVDDMLDCANDAKPASKDKLMGLALQVPEFSRAKVLESCETRRKAIGVGYIVNALKSEIDERQAKRSAA